ncbi:hypothetical protein H4R35_003910 [Dimargaris xerosporica]|nr:hypothetical protein H4R35_003910 [Dimargaris xerosporica]
MSSGRQEEAKAGLDGQLAKGVRHEQGYLPIEDYAIIGNLRTTALCSTDGAIDFFCYPVFDSPSVFARLLDKDKQQYLPNTNVLSTKFLCEDGVAEISDFMPRTNDSSLARKFPLLPWLIRRVKTIRGELTFKVECFPAFNYAQDDHEAKIVSTEQEHEVQSKGGSATASYSSTSILQAHHNLKFHHLPEQLPGTQAEVCPQTVEFISPNMTLDLRCVTLCAEGACPYLRWDLEDRSHLGMRGLGAVCEVTLQENQEIYFVLREPPTRQSQCHQVQDPKLNPSLGVREFSVSDPPLSLELMHFLHDQTIGYWNSWISQSKYKGRWREAVHRSALALKILTYEPTGAVVAAPTFSLPEDIGGTRNWDYRYTWIRDSSFTVYALIRLGMTEEAQAYMGFIEKLFRDKNPDGSLQIMYTIHGDKEMPETELHHLDGYRQSRPVRIGNGAADHLQLDIYGELMDAIYLYNKYGTPIGYEMWCHVRDLVDYVCDHWNLKDMSIWEVRSQKMNYLYSKIMCWVAVDRGIRLSEKRMFPLLQRDKWYRTRDIIYEEIMTKGWNEELQVYTQSYEQQDTLDSSVLIMPLVFFSSPADPRFLNTVKKIRMTPEKGGLTTNNLVFRYNHLHSDDGVGGREGCFSMCTFWLVEALTRAGQYDKRLLKDAINMFENMISYANHVTLYSEEIARSGEALGNFPQAFTHIAMISAAFNLDRVMR